MLPTLKRGQGMSSYSKNWESPSAEWDRQVTYLPNGKETLVGVKKFYNKKYLVFKCMDDSFLAQDEVVCLLPEASDPMEEISILPEDTGEVQQQRKTFIFQGANWKLAGDKKWKLLDKYIDYSALSSLGERKIGDIGVSVFRYDDSSFVAQETY